MDFNEGMVVEYLRHGNNENRSAILAALQEASLLKIQYLVHKIWGLSIRFLFRSVIKGKVGSSAF